MLGATMGNAPPKRGKNRHKAPSDLSEDAGLLAGIRARDQRAFEQLYTKYRPRLTAFLLRLVPRPGIIEEAIDDTMMAVWDRPGSFKGDSKASTWLFAIATHKTLKLLRNNRALSGHADDQIGEDLVGSDQSKQRVQLLLARALCELTDEHRNAIDLAFFHDKRYREISEIMNCPVSTVKTRIFHAKQRLRRALGGELTDWL